MTMFNYIGLAIEGLFGGVSLLLLMIAFIEASWKWFLGAIFSMILFFTGAVIAIM